MATTLSGFDNHLFRWLLVPLLFTSVMVTREGVKADRARFWSFWEERRYRWLGEGPWDDLPLGEAGKVTKVQSPMSLDPPLRQHPLNGPRRHLGNQIG